MKKQVIFALTGLTLFLMACGGLNQRYSETLEERFVVGDTLTLIVDNFAGDVIIRTGDGGVVDVQATKRAAREKDLDRIEVLMRDQDGELQVETDPPSGLKNVSVDLEITVPSSSDVDLRTGAGDIIVRDLDGDVRADSGAGDVDIRGTTSTVDAHVGAGSIDYRGQPQGYCRFDTGAGTIKLRLPTDVNIAVDLDTGVGDIDVDFDVDGRVSNRSVRGTIGTGAEGEIRASTGAGNIDLVSQ
jgi:DUF4097 and DUF4098 domain-containing protein YvlB